MDRLALEVEVANSNAAHHQKTSVERGERIHKMRSILRAVNLLLHSGDIIAITPGAEEDARKLSELITEELG